MFGRIYFWNRRAIRHSGGLVEQSRYFAGELAPLDVRHE
jgi:hypothetical protein